MKMNNRALCCDQCLYRISQKSTASARLWLDLCDIYMASPLFGLVMPDNDTLRNLELLGFITTTEKPTMILVKVLGYHEVGNESFFCGGNCDDR